METKDFEKLQNEINKKLGKEAFATISNEMATLLQDNSEMNKKITEQSDTISNLEKSKQSLLETNASLSQKITTSFKDPFKPQIINEEKPNSTCKSYASCFDKNGNFIN